VTDHQVVAALLPGFRPRLLVVTRRWGDAADRDGVVPIELTLSALRVRGGRPAWCPEVRVTEDLVWDSGDGRHVVRWVDGDLTIVARRGSVVAPSPWGLARLARIDVSGGGSTPFALARGRHRGVVVDGPATPATPARRPAAAPVTLLRPPVVVTDPALSSPVPSGA
jgi:hypothetical protein